MLNLVVRIVTGRLLKVKVQWLLRGQRSVLWSLRRNRFVSQFRPGRYVEEKKYFAPLGNRPQIFGPNLFQRLVHIQI